jgi:hypothetical protein
VSAEQRFASKQEEDSDGALLAVEISAAHRLLVALDSRVGSLAAVGNSLVLVGLGLFGLWLYAFAQAFVEEGAVPAFSVGMLALHAAVALLVLFLGLRYRECGVRLGFVAMDLRDELILARAVASEG